MGVPFRKGPKNRQGKEGREGEGKEGITLNQE